MKGVPGLQWLPTKTYGDVDLGLGWSRVVGRQDEVPAAPTEFSLTPGSSPDPVPSDETAPEEVPDAGSQPPGE